MNKNFLEPKLLDVIYSAIMPLLVYRCLERRPTTVSSAKRTLCGRAGRRKAASWLWAGLYRSMPGLPHHISGRRRGKEVINILPVT
jgi:hypothetical protein